MPPIQTLSMPRAAAARVRPAHRNSMRAPSISCILHHTEEENTRMPMAARTRLTHTSSPGLSAQRRHRLARQPHGEPPITRGSCRPYGVVMPRWASRPRESWPNVPATPDSISAVGHRSLLKLNYKDIQELALMPNNALLWKSDQTTIWIRREASLHRLTIKVWTARETCTLMTALTPSCRPT